MNRTVLLFMGVIAMWACVPRLAQAQTGSGFYLSSELGVLGASSLNFTGSSNDRASVCDEFINPMYAMVTTISGYESYNCTGPDRVDWRLDEQFRRGPGRSGQNGGGIWLPGEIPGPRSGVAPSGVGVLLPERGV